MIATEALLDEIRAEAHTRVLAGRKLDEVRLHPVTFQKLVQDLGARVICQGGYPESLRTLSLTMDVGTGHPVTVIADPAVTVLGHPRFAPAASVAATPITEQELIGIEMDAAIGDYGTHGEGARMQELVAEFRAQRQRIAELEAAARVRDVETAVRAEADRKVAARGAGLAQRVGQVARGQVADAARLKLPKHIWLAIRHNDHAVNYQPLETWLENEFLSAEAGGIARDEHIRPEDLAEIRRTGEVWELDWCPDSPVGSCRVIAATLERALELANADE